MRCTAWSIKRDLELGCPGSDKELLEEALGSTLVAMHLHMDIKYIAILANGPPPIVTLLCFFIWHRL